MNANKKTFELGAALALAGTLAVAGLTGCYNAAPAGAAAAGTAAAVPEHAITVTASSEVQVTPDRASITVSAYTQGATAALCQQDNAETVNAVIDALLAAGIAEPSIQTTNTYLYPQRDYSLNGTGEVVGYEMETTLSVDDLEIDQVGPVVQAAIAAGATDIGGIRYYASTYDEAYAEALAAAVDAARDKAQVLADASGNGLGAIVDITEGYQNTAYRYDSGSTLMAAAKEEDAAFGKTMPGEIDVTAQVTVSFAI